MPNLTLRASADDLDRLRELLPLIADLMSTTFDVSDPNVMLIEMSASIGTARLYVEVLYLEGAGRSVDHLKAFAQELAKLTGCEDGHLAFRGFPVCKGEIVSLDQVMGRVA